MKGIHKIFYSYLCVLYIALSSDRPTDYVSCILDPHKYLESSQEDSIVYLKLELKNHILIYKAAMCSLIYKEYSIWASDKILFIYIM